MKPDTPPLGEITLSLPDVATLFRVSQVTAARYAREEGMPRVSHGRYNLLAIVHWRLEKLAHLVGNGSDGLTAKREELLGEQIVGVRMENEARAAELLPAEDVKTDCMAYAAIVAGALESLPARVAATVATMTDPTVIQSYLRSECSRVRQSAAEGLAKYAAELSDDPPPAPPAGPRRGRPTRIARAVKQAHGG